MLRVGSGRFGVLVCCILLLLHLCINTCDGCRTMSGMNVTDAVDLVQPVKMANASACCALCTTTVNCTYAVFVESSLTCHRYAIAGYQYAADGYTLMFVDTASVCNVLNASDEMCATTAGCDYCQTENVSLCINTTIEQCCGIPGYCEPVVCEASTPERPVTCCMPSDNGCVLSGAQCCVSPQGDCCAGYEVSACYDSTTQQCCGDGAVCALNATCCSNTDPSSPYSICCDSGTVCCSSPALDPQCCSSGQRCDIYNGCVE